MDNFHPENFVERCLAGNAQAFEPLVRRYQNAAFATALRYVRSRVDAQDIVQDAFVSAYCRLGQLRDKECFGGWLMHIVANRCKDWLRDRRRTQPLDSAEMALENAAAAEHADQMRRLELQEAVDLLPEHYRSAVLMYYLSGLSYREIAELMEIPLSTVCGRLQQGRIRLRQLWDEHEEIAMKPIDVTEQVQEVVCQIATRQVQETIPLGDTDHIVFYCALDTDLEIRQAEGGDAVLEGTLSAIGLTREKARESVEGIEIGADQVDSFLESGPHEGEVFMRTHQQNDQVKAVSQGSGQLWRAWRAYLEGGIYPWGVTNGVKTTDVFSQMQVYAGGSMPADMRLGLGRATRITVYREKLEDIILPPSALTAEVQKVFRPNSTSLERVHGPIGSASLVLLVPKGKRVTVIKGKQVCASGLQGSISFIESTCEEVADIEGDVELFDSALETARNIRGKVCQRYYRYLGMRMDGYKARRLEAEDCQLEDIRGGVNIDVSNVQLKAARLGGRVRIYNRFGQTQLHQDQLAADSRIELESCAGDIHLSLKEALLDEILLDKVRLSAFTLCGQIHAFEGRDENKPLIVASSFEMLLLSNAPSREEILAADFMLKSEVGAVIIEKAK